MKSWPKVKLGEACAINPKVAPPAPEQLISVVPMSAVSESGEIDASDVRPFADVAKGLTLFQEGDVLFAKITPCMENGKGAVAVGLRGGVGAGSTEFFVLRPDGERALSAWIYHFTKRAAFRRSAAERMTGSAGQRRVPRAFLERVALPLPPLDEQARIAAELDAVAATLRKRQTQLAELDALVQARFVELFGDPATNPKGWPTGTIRDIVSEVKYGTSKPATVDGRFNYLRMNNITYDGYLDLSDLKKIDVPEAEVEKYIVRKNDVLFNRTNSKELVGKTCVFDADEPMIIAGYIIRIRVNEKATPLFLSRFLNSRYGKTTLFNMCKAIVGQANINAQELQKIAIFIPPLALQERFAAEVERVEALKTTVRAGIAETRTLFDALSQRYFG